MEYISSQFNIVVKDDDDDVFLYNSYSGAFARLEKKVYVGFVEQIISDEHPCEYFDELLAEGFLKPKKLNEYNRILLQERMAVYESSADSISLVIAPTLSCNLNCVYCFEAQSRCNKFVSEETINDIVSFISKQLRQQTKKLHITWFGGEPLVAYQSILVFNEKLKEILPRNISYMASMITNGTLLDELKAKALAEQCALKNVQITIDGTQDIYCKQKGATPEQFMHVMDNIATALKYVRVSVRFNCARNNFDDIKRVASQVISRCGAHKNLNLYLAKLVDYTCSCDSNYYLQDEFDIRHIEFDKYVCNLLQRPYKPRLPRYRKNFCGLYKLKNFVIGPEGEIYKCEHHVGMAEKIVGDIRCGLYYTDDMINFMNTALYDKCKSCSLLPLCIGGCPSVRQDLQNEDTCRFSLEYIKQLLSTYIE